MKTIKLNVRNQLWLSFLMMILVVSAGVVQSTYAQEWRWFRIGSLQCFFSNRGTEVENEGYGPNTDFFTWPADYGLEQTSVRQKGMWIGCKNFYDTVLGKTLSYKVVGIGPREAEERQYMIFEQGIQLIAKNPHPTVVVDNQIANHLANYEEIDGFDENLPCDRMIVITINTSIGVTVTKKILAFSQPGHDNYFLYDITFKNTGIINRAGEVYKQTLEDAYFYFVYRYAFSGESVGGSQKGWGASESTWGANTLNHAFGNNPLASDFNDPSSPRYQMRAFYSTYGPAIQRPVTFEEDWGCPNENIDGVMSGARYAGCVTIHADTDPHNSSDDIYQPSTTWYVTSDEGVWSSGVSQYDEVYLKRRYDFMSEGHPPMSHMDFIAENYQYAQEYQRVDMDRNAGGGTSQGQGYGPYTLEPGDSVRIVFAEGMNGISRQKNREVGANWLQYYNGTGSPELVMPDGSITADHNAYKKAWVFTGVDSILKTFRNAILNYNANYNIPQPPPPPETFTVQSGGDRINLSWSDNATTYPHFDGYVIYRSEGSVLDPKTVYEKIFECNATNVVHTYDDITAARGFDYYYYIQSKDDGSTEAGKVLKSGMFWTVTSVPANLKRPSVPKTPTTPEVDSNSWGLMSSKGVWVSGSDYGPYDAVSYNDLIFVCVDSVSGDSAMITPNLNIVQWKLTISKGEWISGAGYHAYDVVTYNGLTYVCLTTIPAGKGLDLVRVVPNPYDMRARAVQFGEDFQYDRIVFYGLPGVCTLKIFTERGDLIYEKYHDDGSGDEIWNSKTRFGQIIVSGIYILYVETPDGRSVIRKFVVIR